MVQTRARAQKRKIEEKNSTYTSVVGTIEPPAKRAKRATTVKPTASKAAKSTGKRSQRKPAVSKSSRTRPPVSEAQETVRANETVAHEIVQKEDDTTVQESIQEVTSNVTEMGNSSGAAEVSQEHLGRILAFCCKEYFDIAPSSIEPDTAISSELLTKVFTLYAYSIVVARAWSQHQDASRPSDNKQQDDTLQEAVAICKKTMDSHKVHIWDVMKELGIRKRCVEDASEAELGSTWALFKAEMDYHSVESQPEELPPEVGELAGVEEEAEADQVEVKEKRQDVSEPPSTSQVADRKTSIDAIDLEESETPLDCSLPAAEAPGSAPAVPKVAAKVETLEDALDFDEIFGEDILSY